MNNETQLELAKLLFSQDALSCDTQSSNSTPFEVGKKYLIRTVTHIDVGECVSIVGGFVILKDAAWIADTGRYHDCLTKGDFKEIEPYPNDVFVSIGCICDATEWKHELPRGQK